ncbi:MAG: 2-5 ligase [Acidobacteria bacterium]|jgi:2'-5' RNA ligase|nr:2-5 ligase [Acidobacteriota bacterium]
MPKRIFIAVDISERVRREVAVYAQQLRKEFADLRVGWEKPEKLHLTLKFLGETGETQLKELFEIAENIAADVPAFHLQITDTGVFPSARNPRILWLDVKDEMGSLAVINNRIENECEKIGFARENRSFKPHLTIARLREPGKSKLLAEKHLGNKFEPARFEVAEILVYESRLQPAGSIYAKLKSFELKTQMSQNIETT